MKDGELTITVKKKHLIIVLIAVAAVILIAGVAELLDSRFEGRERRYGRRERGEYSGQYYRQPYWNGQPYAQWGFQPDMQQGSQPGLITEPDPGAADNSPAGDTGE